MTARDPLRREEEPNGQRVLPGAEASTRQAIAARAAPPLLRASRPQLPLGCAQTPLFDVTSSDQPYLPL